MSNETKIGLLTLISIASLIWGYKFIKGKNILSSSQIIYVKYDHVDGLAPSSPVTIRGKQVGIVSDIYFENDMQSLEVVLDLETDVRIPKDATANIVSTGFMGGKAVVLEIGAPCSDAAGSKNPCAKSTSDQKAYIKGRTKGLVSSMIGDPKDVEKYITVFKDNLGGIVDSLKAEMGIVAGEGGGQTMGDLKAIVSNLKNVTESLDRLMNRSSNDITGMLDNLESVTGNLKNNNAQINSILGNAETFTNKLNEADLAGTVDKASKAMEDASAALTNIKTTLSSADAAVQDLSNVLQKVNGTDGTLGLLINDKQIYNDLDRALKNADFLMQDFRLHPERYRRILSKKKMPYEKPANDPAFQE